MVLLFVLQNNAQTKLNLEQTLALAIKNNTNLKASNLKIDKSNALIKNAFTFDKTSIYYSYDESNLALNNIPLRVFGIAQDFKFPTVYFADKKVHQTKVTLEESAYDIKYQQIKKVVSSSFYQLVYTKNKAKTYAFLDSLYQDFAKKATRRFELGETNYLEMITAKSKQKQLETLYKQALQEVILSEEKLKAVVQVEFLEIVDENLSVLEVQTISTNENVGLQYFENAKNYEEALYKLEKQNLLPDISLEYFQGTNDLLNNNLTGYQIGLKIPLLFSGNSSKIKASKISKNIVEAEEQNYKLVLEAQYKSLLATLNQYKESIHYYHNEGENLKNEILKTANRTFKEGEIDFFQYLQSIETAKEIELSYLDNLNTYNQTIININYLTLNPF